MTTNYCIFDGIDYKQKKKVVSFQTDYVGRTTARIRIR